MSANQQNTYKFPGLVILFLKKISLRGKQPVKRFRVKNSKNVIELSDIKQYKT